MRISESPIAYPQQVLIPAESTGKTSNFIWALHLPAAVICST